MKGEGDIVSKTLTSKLFHKEVDNNQKLRE